MEKADILKYAAEAFNTLDLSFKGAKYDPFAGLDEKLPAAKSASFAKETEQAYVEASLLSLFSREEFARKFGTVAVNTLLSDSTYVDVGGKLLWTLSSDVRRAQLARIDIDSMRRILDAWPDRERDALQRLIDGSVYSEKLPAIESQNLQDLGVMLTFVDLFGEVFSNLPTPKMVRAEIDWYRLLQPFKDLAGTRFAGREDELHELSDYVGAVGPSNWFEGFKAFAREITNFHEKPPLMIQGAGGMGKSTLLAHFVLIHTRNLGKGSIPFIYIDFDRSGLSVEQSLSVLSEALRQLAIQFPNAQMAFSQVRRNWQRVMEEQRYKDQTNVRPGVKWSRVLADKLRHRVVREFVSMVQLYELGEKPLLLLLDTFEEIQNRHPALVRSFWEFLEELQTAHPRLRVVLSGRTLLNETFIHSSRTDIDIKIRALVLTGMNKKDCLDFFSQSNIPRKYARRLLEHLHRDDQGVSPLTLRVAAELWQQNIKEGKKPEEILDQTFWTDLRAGRVQEQLINRYLKHISDPDVRKLASPGFVLRKLTPRLILEVLAEPCEVEVSTLDGASVLFDRLRDDISLVYSRHPREHVLYPRAETRSAILELLNDLEPDRVKMIHANAVDYYQRRSDSEQGTDDDRLEELYHRLSLEQSVDEIAPRWPDDPQIVAILLSVSNEFAEPAQNILRTFIGEKLSPEQQRAVNTVEWERRTLPKATLLLRKGDYDALLKLLSNNDERLDGSDLYVIEVKALNRTGQTQRAQELAERGLKTFDDSTLSGTAMSLLIEGTKSCLANGKVELARQWLDWADYIAAQREDLAASLSIVLEQIDIKAGMNETTLPELQRLERDAYNISDHVAQTVLVQFTKATALLGWRHVWLVRKAIRIGALDGLTGSHARRLARTIGLVETDYSQSRREPPGRIAASLGLSSKGSVTDVWRDLLMSRAERRASTLDDLLALISVDGRSPETKSKSTLSLEECKPILKELVSLFQELLTVETLQESREPTKPRRRAKLAGSQRKTLVSGIFNSFSIDGLRQLFEVSLKTSLDSIVKLKAPFQRVAFDILKWADSTGNLSELIVALREARPADPKLLAVANELGLSTVQFDDRKLERIIEENVDFVDVGHLVGRLGEAEGRVCRIEAEGPDSKSTYGTGFLVSPNLLLTSLAVLSDVIDGKSSPSDVRFLFDFKATKTIVSRGVEFRLSANDWLVANLPFDEHAGLGILLLRTEGFPGDEPVGGQEGIGAPVRGWVSLEGRVPNPDSSVLILHYAKGGPLKLSLAAEGVELLGPNHFIHEVRTTAGASGAPCFDAEMNLVGVHQGIRDGEKYATRVDAIVKRLSELQVLDEVGRPLV